MMSFEGVRVELSVSSGLFRSRTRRFGHEIQLRMSFEGVRVEVFVSAGMFRLRLD